MSNVWINAAGTVFAKSSWRADYTQFCNVTVEMGGVGVTTCLTWFAILRNAMQRQSQVTVNYLGAPACNALPAYGNSPIPFYAMRVS